VSLTLSPLVVNLLSDHGTESPYIDYSAGQCSSEKEVKMCECPHAVLIEAMEQ
jgi:hypothetical protein